MKVEYMESDETVLSVESYKPFTKKEKEQLHSDVQHIELSTSGRGDFLSIGGNAFIQEAVILLHNSVNLFQIGYFDCAFYSLRQTLEVVTIIIAFSDLPQKERDEKISAWKSNSYFPVQNKLIKQLKEKGIVINDMKIHMPTFFNLITDTSEQINKFVHKQGFQHFYAVRRIKPLSEKQKVKEKDEFLQFLRKVITITAIMRLAVDPFPILLMDEEILFRCFDTFTEPYGEEFVKTYIGERFINEYKNTSIYQSYYSTFINEEKKNNSVFDIVHFQFIDTTKRQEILSQLHLLDFYDSTSVQIVFCCEKIVRVSYLGGIHLCRTNRATIKAKNDWSWHSNQFDQYENSYAYNQVYQEGYISVIHINGESFYIEHEIPFNETDIQAIENCIIGIENV